MSYRQVQWIQRGVWADFGTVQRPEEWQDQRMVAQPVCLLEHKGIVFEDLSRNISGFIELVRLPELDSEVAEVTMFNYDRGIYRSIPMQVRNNQEKLQWRCQ